MFAYVTDPTRFSEWQKGVVSGQMHSVGAPQVGDRCLTTRRIGFADRPSTAELVRFDPPNHWSVRGADGPIRAMIDVTVEPRSDTAAKLTIALDFEGHGIGRLLVALIVRGEARREIPVNVAMLKQRLEDSIWSSTKQPQGNGGADSSVRWAGADGPQRRTPSCWVYGVDGSRVKGPVMPTPKHGQATIEIAAEPAVVYDLISDITRMGEWSPECYRCDWVGEIQEPVVGARFQGHNRMGPIRWTTTCEIVTADRGREFAFTVMHDKNNRESTRWRYRFSETDTATVVTESFEFVWCPLASRIGELFLPRGRVLRAGLNETVQRIRVVAESNVAVADESELPPRYLG